MSKPIKPVAVFDIDGTVYRSSLYIEMVNQLLDNGVIAPKARAEYIGQYEEWRSRTGSYFDYMIKLAEMFTKQLKGMKVVELEKASRQVVENTHLHTYKYTRDLINKLRRTHFLIAISGSPEPIVKLFASKHGFHSYSATELLDKNQKYVGVGSFGFKNKDLLLRSIIKEHGLNLSGSVGVGDTGDDTAILKLVENPIAFNPNIQLYGAARKAKWKIVVERKDVSYELTSNKHGKYQLA